MSSAVQLSSQQREEPHVQIFVPPAHTQICLPVSLSCFWLPLSAFSDPSVSREVTPASLAGCAT